MSSRVPLEVLQVAQGARITPIAPNSNNPFLDDWPEENSTSDPRELEQIVEAFPGYNWGLVTGKVSRQFGIDCDAKDPKRNGMEWYYAKIREHGLEWTNTRKVHTAHDGLHLHYAWPDGYEIDNNQDGLAPGVDVKAHRGCLVIPPSVRDGKRYFFEDCDATKVPAPVPAWLLAELVEKGIARRIKNKSGEPEILKVRKTALEEVYTRVFPPITSNAPEQPQTPPNGKATVGGIPSGKGERHRAFKREAIRLVQARITYPGLLAHFLEINQKWFAESYPLEEVRRQAESWHKWVGEHFRASAGVLFALATLKDLFMKPQVPVEYVLEGILVAGTVSGIFAKPKVGKSTLARNLCIRVARGDDFWGHATRQGKCIYLALEEREEDVINDFRAMGATGEEPIEIYAGPAPAQPLIAVCELVREHRPRVLFIDSLIRIARVKDESSYAEIYEALGPLIDVARETGTHILLTHHSGKEVKADPIDAPLGSTGIAGAVATVVVLKRTSSTRTIETVQRVGKDTPETILEFDSQTKTLSLGEVKAEAEFKAAGKGILEYLATVKEPKTEKEIDEAVEGRTVHKRKALRELVEGEEVRREGEGKKGLPFRYCCSALYIHRNKEQEFFTPPEPAKQEILWEQREQAEQAEQREQEFRDGYEDDED